MRMQALKELKKKSLGIPEKVTVSADSEKGLEEGLEKAKDIISGKSDILSSLKDLESDESHDEEDDEEMDLSDEAIDNMSEEELRHCLKKLRD